MLDLKHKNLDVWKKSITLISMVYDLTKDFPRSEIYGITTQLRRAAVSISSNIAEGASRISPKDRARFFEIARSSLVEIDTQLEVAKNLNYIKFEIKADELELKDIMNHLFAMLSNLIKN